MDGVGECLRESCWVFLLLGFCVLRDTIWRWRVLENVKEKVVGYFGYRVSVFFVIRDVGGGCWIMFKRKLLGFSVAGFLCSL